MNSEGSADLDTGSRKLRSGFACLAGLDQMSCMLLGVAGNSTRLVLPPP